jgi:DNA-3-methyladenine glycosylase II
MMERMRSPVAGACLEVEVRPPWPYRLPASGGSDTVMRVRRGIVARVLHVEGAPVMVRAAQRRDGTVLLRADGESAGGREVAIERMRFALGVDDDYRPLYDRFRSDRLLGGAIRRRRWHRPRRRPWPWEALAWSITMQLIESSRAAQIQRRMVYRWGIPAEGPDGTTLRDVPTPELVAGRAPAELAAIDLAPARALALIRAAREVAAGRVDPGDPAHDRRLLAIREIGPWTVQCLGLYGRGEPDSLPAGDLGFVKLVGRLASLGRRATVEEVEEFFAPYAPYRGLAGSFVLAAYHKAVATGPPLRFAA